MKAIDDLSTAMIASTGSQYMPYISNFRHPRQILIKLKSVITPLAKQDTEMAERKFEEVVFQTGTRDWEKWANEFDKAWANC